MNLKCLFGHDWHNVVFLAITSDGRIREDWEPKCYYLGHSHYYDRICKRCDKIQLNASLAIADHKKQQLILKEQERIAEMENEKFRQRFNKYKKLKCAAEN